MDGFRSTRRRLVRAAGGVGLGIGLGAGLGAFSAMFAPMIVARQSTAAAAEGTAGKLKERVGTKGSEEVTPPEDLMREHGVLDRALLIYEAAMRRLVIKEEFDPATLTGAAEVIRDFIENYHERQEEQYVFPRFRQAGKLVELVNTLEHQHEAGRRVTAAILGLAPNSRKSDDERGRLIGAVQSFITMYRPHAAHEDTDLFPKLKDIVSSHEYDSMAEEFEKKEHQMFGDDGFEKMVDRIASLERAIGIADLNQFTPR